MTNTPPKLLLVAMAMFLWTTFLVSAKTVSVQEWNTWPEIRFPKLTLQVLEDSDRVDKSDVAKEPPQDFQEKELKEEFFKMRKSDNIYDQSSKRDSEKVSTSRGNVDLHTEATELKLSKAGQRDIFNEPSRTQSKGGLHSGEGSGLELRAIGQALSFQKASARNLSEVQRTHITIKELGVPLNLSILQATDLGHSTDDILRPVSDLEGKKSRKKRHIFGPDTRHRITDSFRKVFPFSAAVQLSTGCSGILIGPRHVLTAAECIHTGKRYRGSAKNLHVGLIRIESTTTLPSEHLFDSPSKAGKHDDYSDRLLWYEVDQIYLPNTWVSPSFMEKREYSNYAVLELTENHNHDCMEVGVSSIINTDYRQRIHFSAFEDYQYYPDPFLTYRHCFIVGDTTNFLYEQCDATKSAVGAGVYLRMWDAEGWQWSRRVVAIKTSETSRVRVSGKREKVHQDVRITVLNFAQICYWVMGDFEVCSRGRIEDACLVP